MEKHTWHRAQSSNRASSNPLPRWGHSCCVIEDEVVFFGGYAQSVYMNDVWTFNTHNMQWKEIKTTGKIPSVRSNCSMSYDSLHERIVIFGGGGPNKKRFNSINILDWKTKQWSEILPKEQESSPWERTYHSAELIYPYLIVYGGEGVSDMDDLWIYNFETGSWKEVPVNKQKPYPCARRFHSSALVGNKFFVIGGCHGKYRCLSDVYCIDLTDLVQNGDVEHLQWKDCKPVGSAFLTRWGHSSVTYNDKIYIFGGRFSNDLNDLLVLDIEKNVIKTMKIGSQLPKARRRHSACFVGSCMLIFGGFNGQYYNDLYYINVFELKSKLQIASNEEQNIQSVFTSNNADVLICSSDNQLVWIDSGLLMKGFKNQYDRDMFVLKAQCKFTKTDLVSIMNKISKGYGSLTKEQREEYNISIPETQEEYEDYLRNELFKIEEQPQKCLLRRKNLLPNVIQLNDEQFSSFLDQNRQSIYKDSTIVINNSYMLRTNSGILSLRSEYFRLAFSRNFKQNTKELKLKLYSSNLVIFQIALNFLILEKVVVPMDMGICSWIQLYEMADYFCIDKLKCICEQQLLSLVTENNYNEVFQLALQIGLKNLALYCADFLIKFMVNQEDKFQLENNGSDEKNRIIEKMYSLSKFDILQVKMERLKIVEECLRKKQSSISTEQDDKENFETSQHSINCD